MKDCMSGVPDLSNLFEFRYDLYKFIDENLPDNIVGVFDADDFLTDPNGFLHRFCSSIGIPFKDTLSWDRKEIPSWQSWNEWHRDCIESTRVEPISLEQIQEKRTDKLQHLLKDARLRQYLSHQSSYYCKLFQLTLM